MSLVTKRHFLFQHSGSIDPTQTQEPINVTLTISYLAGSSSLLPNERKRKGKKIHLNYFPKADFFSFLFLLKQETLRCKSKSRKYFTILKSHLQFGSVMNEILSTEHWWTAWPSVDAREGSSTQTRSQTVPGDTLAFSLLSVRSVPASVLPVKASMEGSWKLIWNAPLN